MDVESTGWVSSKEGEIGTQMCPEGWPCEDIGRRRHLPAKERGLKRKQPC